MKPRIKGRFLPLPKRRELNSPTFSQFLEFIITDPNGIENHWLPYTSCSPCHLDYKAIIKLETAEQDNQYVLQRSRLKNWTTYKKQHVTKGGASNDKDIRNRYFSDVSCDLLRRVYQFYKRDFELFDYKPDEFYDICKDSN